MVEIWSEYWWNMGWIWLEYRWNMGGIYVGEYRWNISEIWVERSENIFSRPISWHCQKLGLFGLDWHGMAENGLQWMENGMDILVLSYEMLFVIVC